MRIRNYYVVNTAAANPEQAVRAGWPHPFLSVEVRSGAPARAAWTEYPVNATSGDRRSMADLIKELALPPACKVMSDAQACAYNLVAAQNEFDGLGTK